MYVHESFDHTWGHNGQPDLRKGAVLSVREVFSDQLVALLAKPLFLCLVLVQGPICVALVAWPYLVRFQD